MLVPFPFSTHSIKYNSLFLAVKCFDLLLISEILGKPQYCDSTAKMDKGRNWILRLSAPRPPPATPPKMLRLRVASYGCKSIDWTVP